MPFLEGLKKVPYLHLNHIIDVKVYDTYFVFKTRRGQSNFLQFWKDFIVCHPIYLQGLNSHELASHAMWYRN